MKKPHMKTQGLIFDVDETLVKTDGLHYLSWFHAGRKLRLGDLPANVYVANMSGKPREDSAVFMAEFLAPALSRGAQLSIAAELSDTKNALYKKLLQRTAINIYPDTVRLLLEAKQNHLPLGFASSSTNARSILASVNVYEKYHRFFAFLNPGQLLLDLFDAGLDGNWKDRPGKPKPYIFQEVAARLNVRPEYTVVFDDAVAGIKAGRAGNFFAVGMARKSDSRQSLFAAGSDLVYETLPVNIFNILEEKMSVKTQAQMFCVAAT